MNPFAKLLFAGILVLVANGAFAQGDLDIEAPASWQTFNNGSSVRIDVARITNRSNNVTTGTVHIILRATTTPEIVGPGYTMADINMANYTDDTGRLGPGEGWANISISVPFTAPPNGTYYTHIAVVEYPTLTTVRDHLTSNGTVTFGSSNPPPPPPPPTPPPTGDDHGNSFSTATVVSPNSSRNGRLEATGDIDVFRFTVSQSGILSLSSSGTTDTVGSLFDASQTLIARNDDGGNGLNFGFETPVSAGTYYIAVSGFDNATTGNYTLSVGFTPDGSNPPPPRNPPAGDDGGGGGSLGWASLFALAAAAWRRRRKK